MKVKGMKEVCPKSNKHKKAEVAILIDKKDFKKETITRDKQGIF